MSPTAYQIATLLMTAIAACCALYVARRQGSWRQTDEAKLLMGKVADHETRLQTLQPLPAKVADHENRLGIAETKLASLPTKEDFARLEGELQGVGREVSNAASGIDRLESYFLKRGIDA